MKNKNTTQPLRKLAFAIAATTSLFAASDCSAGLHVWQGTSLNGPYFSDPDNWKSGGVPTANEANVVLEFPVTLGNQQPIVDIPNLKVDKILLQSGYTFFGLPQGSQWTIRGTTGAVDAGSNNLTVHSSLETVLTGATVMDVDAGRSILFQGKIIGAGGIVKTGLGGLELAGNTSNAYLGQTFLNQGSMRLSKTAGVAIPGDIVVGDGAGGEDVDLLRLLGDNQIYDFASVLVKSSGHLSLNGNDDLVGAITLEGGHISTGAGLLSLNATISSLAHATSSLIEGRLDLGNRGRIFTVADGSIEDDLIINAVISGANGAGFSKEGPGLLRLAGANLFSGQVSISEGALLAANNTALGTTARGTVVHSGAALWIGPVNIPDEAIALNGVGGNYLGALVSVDGGGGIVDGQITLASNARIHAVEGSVFRLRGAITGDGGYEKTGLGEVIFSGLNPNTHSGPVKVTGGTLTLSKASGVISIPTALTIGESGGPALPRDTVKVASNDQIANSVPVTIHKSGSLTLQGASDVITSLNLTGGEARVNGGTLGLLGHVTCSAPNAEMAFINGSGGILRMETQTTIFTVQPLCALRVTVPIGGVGVVGIIKKGTGLLDLHAANTYRGRTTVEAGSLFVTGPNGNLGTAEDGTTVNKGAQLGISWVDLGAEALTFLGDPADGSHPIFGANGDCTVRGPISIQAGVNTFEAQTVLLTATGEISGNGSLRLLGNTVNNNPTRFVLTGLAANKYTGDTVLQDAELWMSKAPGLAAIPGNLQITDRPSQVVAPSRVFWMFNDQISNAASIRAGLGAELQLGNAQDSIESLQLKGARVRGTNGICGIAGGILVEAGAQSSISGGLKLLGGEHIIHVQGDAGGITELLLGGKVTGAGVTSGFKKTGPGDMAFGAANTFEGPVKIAEGYLMATHDKAFGSTTGGVSVEPGASLALWNSIKIAGEILTLKGAGRGGFPHPGALINTGGTTNTWDGPVNLAADTVIHVADPEDRLILDDAVTGAGSMTKTGKGVLEFAGTVPNVHQGMTIAAEGILALNKANGGIAVPGGLQVGADPVQTATVKLFQPEQIADLSRVQVESSGTLDLNNLAETIGSLEGAGSVSTSFATLTAGQNNQSTVFSGTIGGVGFVTLVKKGTGVMKLTGANAYSGRTHVEAGTLLVDGSLTGAVRALAGGTFGGNGSVGTIAVTNGIVSPGSSPGRLKSKGLAMNSASTFRADLDGPVVGSGYDQLEVTGAVNLGSAELFVNLGALPAGAFNYILIQNDGADPIGQTFKNLPEGAVFDVGAIKFRITYAGGDGNDVVIRTANTPPALLQPTVVSSTDEGTVVEFSGTISDPDVNDTFKLGVIWGDGTPAVFYDLPAGTTTFKVTHTYADDNPTSTPADAYVLEYTLLDPSGPGAGGNKIIQVRNVAPVISAIPTVDGYKNEQVTQTVSFQDPGTDSWTATVDYGDGTGDQAITVQPDKTLQLNHTYSSTGTFVVNVRVQDDDTGVGTQSFVVNVSDTPAGPALSIEAAPGGQVVLSWGSADPTFVLESRPLVNEGAWAPVPKKPVVSGDEYSVTLLANQAAQFFRLRKP